jgi:hypothetical protein
MNILAAKYANQDRSSLVVSLDTGEEWHMPFPCRSWHNAHLQEFLRGGGTIEDPDPVVVPDPNAPTVEDRVRALESELAAMRSRVDELERARGAPGA